VVTLQNGLGNEEQLAQYFPREQILGGICFVGLNRIAPGVIQHLGEGMILLGEFAGWPEPRTQDLATMIRNAGVPCKVAENLIRSRWEKLVWNVPFNGLGMASAAGYDAVVGAKDPSSEIGECLTTDKLLDHGRWEDLVRELMIEVIATANALGLSVPVALAEKQITRTRPLGPYRASTQLDFEAGRPLELEGLFFEPLRQAKKAGVSTPRLAKLCKILTSLALRISRQS
jgi:2-dehydropantoate 2-reductase